MAEYEIHFSKARAARGLKAWGVFEIVDENFSRGISQHATEEEAQAVLNDLRDNEATLQAEIRAQDGK